MNMSRKFYVILWVAILGAVLLFGFLPAQDEESEIPAFMYVWPGLNDEAWAIVTDGGMGASFKATLVDETGLTPWPGVVGIPDRPEWLGLAWEGEGEFITFQQVEFSVGVLADGFRGSMVLESDGPLAGFAQRPDGIITHLVQVHP